jgi:Uma2 family endonuclease
MATTTTMTGAEFDALPYDEGRRWELINGELIAMPSPTARHQRTVFQVLTAVVRHVETGGTEGAAGQDLEFALTDDDRVRPNVWVLLGKRAAVLDMDRVPGARRS